MTDVVYVDDCSCGSDEYCSVCEDYDYDGEEEAMVSASDDEDYYEDEDDDGAADEDYR